MAKKRIRRAIKRFMPTQLFARALLILLIPMVVTQGVAAYMFYERHWDSVVRNLSNAVANDIQLLALEYKRELAEEGREAAMAHIDALGGTLNMAVHVEEKSAARPVVTGAGRQEFKDLYYGLQRRLVAPLMIERLRQEDLIRVRIALSDDVIETVMNQKRLVSSTTYVFILWMVGSALLLVVIAILFLRNQVRPIVQLARAAEQFGLGQDVQDFSPHGASEVRRAGNAFQLMADRVRRAVGSRTEMLAGISHDLRTPLTRMKLEMEMGSIDAATKQALSTDIEEMRRMIDEYLDFARGDAGEDMLPTDMAVLVTDVVESYQRSERPVFFDGAESVILMLRPQAIRRALSNLIENALRYGKQADVSLEVSTTFVRVKVADQGPGIPEEAHELVFKPFTRLEASRNVETGGVGLGLSIARDVAQSHGGDIILTNRKDKNEFVTGLEVTLRLPRQTQI